MHLHSLTRLCNAFKHFVVLSFRPIRPTSSSRDFASTWSTQLALNSAINGTNRCVPLTLIQLTTDQKVWIHRAWGMVSFKPLTALGKCNWHWRNANWKKASGKSWINQKRDKSFALQDQLGCGSKTNFIRFINEIPTYICRKFKNQLLKPTLCSFKVQV